ncbi:HNH endonuclease signature motif containing protein [Neisseria sp. Ec49-e6-T10]|uniref:HNH endonuclease signature motif containing protein n=1 Tax=Neisseria sp. Ec49-e6-T10 TaxID=3140744 RepID=UPI003EBC3B02
MERPRLEIDLEILQQQRWQQEQEEQQRIGQKLPEAIEDVQDHLNQNNLLKEFPQEQQKQLTEALAVEVAKKKHFDKIDGVGLSKDGNHLIAHIHNNVAAHLNIRQILTQQQTEQQPNLLERPLPEPKRLNEINKLIDIFNVNEKLSIFKPKEQQTLMQAVGFAIDDFAGRPPKVTYVDINHEQMHLVVGAYNKSIKLDPQAILAQNQTKEDIKQAVPEQEPEQSIRTAIAKSGDSGMAIAKQLDPENPEAALGHLYRSGQVKDIQLKDTHQHIVPNVQPNKEYSYDPSIYTEQEKQDNVQLARQKMTGQTLANEQIDLAAESLKRQQHAQLAQLFQNINHHISNNPNIVQGLNKLDLDNLVQTNLSRYQSTPLINKSVSVVAMYKFSQSESLQAVIDRSGNQSNIAKAIKLAEYTAQNVPLFSIRPLTAQPSMMPIMKMTNHEGNPLTEEQQNAYSKGANEAMFTGLKETLDDANLLSKDILDTVGYSLLGGFYDQAEASKSIQRNNERINGLINSVQFLAGSATGHSMYYSAHPDELVKGMNNLLADRQEQVQQLKAEGRYEELGKTDGKIGFEVLSAFVPLGMTKKVKSVSKAADVAQDISHSINLERKIDKFDSELVRNYIKDIEFNTERKIHSAQIEKLKEALRDRNYEYLSPLEVAKHRADFNRKKNNLINEWEKSTNQKWPTYSEDVIGENGKIVRKAGDKYDAHHIIENSYGGNNEWWNIHPAKFPNEHQGGIHRSGSPAREIFGKGKE